MNKIDEIVQPLLRHWRKDLGSLFIVNHGCGPIEDIRLEVRNSLREAGCKVLAVSLHELSPNPVARLVELRDEEGIDVFSVAVDVDRLGEDEGALVRALNLQRSIYARENLHAIFWIHRRGMRSFAQGASNFLDFRTRVVDFESRDGPAGDPEGLDLRQSTLDAPKPRDPLPRESRTALHEISGPTSQRLLSLWREYLRRHHTVLDLWIRPVLQIQRNGGADIDLGRSLTLEAVLGLDRRRHSWITQQWVVLGDPGAGKTTLLRQAAARLAASEDPRWIPIFASLPRSVRRGEQLLDACERELLRDTGQGEGLAAALRGEAREGRLLLLLDGLDEVAAERREEAVALLQNLSLRWPRASIVVTSRRLGYSRPGREFRELMIRPLEEEQQRELLERFFANRSSAPRMQAGDLLKQVSASYELQELARLPLFLTLFALLAEKDVALPFDRSELYDRILWLLLTGKHRAGGALAAPEATRDVLRYLAYGMTASHHEAEPLASLESRLRQSEAEALVRKLDFVTRWRDRPRVFLEDIAEHTGILGPHDGSEADWRFWHRTLREALTSEYLEEIAEKSGLDAVLERVSFKTEGATQWAEPLALLAGRLDSPDALIRRLMSEDRALGLCALANAQRLDDDLLAEALELSGRSQEHARIYRRLPELIDDPEALLRLLDRLRRRTRSGEDLFYIDQAVRNVGERWPAFDDAARRLLLRLYDHIPPPPEELFSWIETVIDGRVPLWKEISAGSFSMGSPEGKGEDDEHPRQTVSLHQPFRMMAVPVTNAHYAAFDPSHHSAQEPLAEDWANLPVTEVRPAEAISFCRWLSVMVPMARGARLPTEAEWEYACRAGSSTRYWPGDTEADLAMVGWYDANSGGRPHRVGEKAANPWGLYDVHGNVWEWTTSHYRAASRGEPAPGNPSKVSKIEPLLDARVLGRIFRGGSFKQDASSARSACRGGSFRRTPWSLADHGFRVLLPALPSSRS